MPINENLEDVNTIYRLPKKKEKLFLIKSNKLKRKLPQSSSYGFILVTLNC